MGYRPHPDADERVRSAVLAIKSILPLDLYPPHKRELISVCLWKLTEAESRGKYNLRFQTPAALEAPRSEKQHEHVVERKSIVDALLASPERADEILERAVGCTVTRDEHRRLTNLGRERPDLEGWDRYRAAGIRVLDLKTGRPHLEE